MYCIKCGKENHKITGDCEFCGQPLVEHELDHEETRLLNKALHTRLNASRERVDNAMVLVVLGSILLIIGFLFFFLSYKLPNAASHDKVIRFTCFEFWVSMVGLFVGGGLLATGLAKLFKEKIIVQREILRTLKAVQYGKYYHMHEHSFYNEHQRELYTAKKREIVDAGREEIRSKAEQITNETNALVASLEEQKATATEEDLPKLDKKIAKAKKAGEKRIAKMRHAIIEHVDREASKAAKA